MTSPLASAWRGLVRGRGLTAVMVLALGLGIATWYVQRQIFAFLASKAPAAPPHLYLVGLERGTPAAGPREVDRLLSSVLLVPREAEALAAAAPGRHTLTFGAPAVLEPAVAAPETVRVRYATRQLFELFAVPLVAGTPWSEAADRAGGPAEAVIDERLARRLFGKPVAAVGGALRVDGAELRVVGVVAARHHDRYHLYERFVVTDEQVYLPLVQAVAARAEPDFDHAVGGGEPGSVMAWVELPTAEARAAFGAAAERRLAGEPRTVTLHAARAWRRVFAPGGTINLWPLLSGMCLATSLLSLVRMLMARFTGRSHGLAVLRAFGARRRTVLGQLLLEAGLIGVVGGTVGLLLGVAMMPLAAGTVVSTPGAPRIIDAGAALVTIGASTVAALVAALYPAWRLVRGTPAAQLGEGR